MNTRPHKMKLITLSLMGILGTSQGFAMEDQREDTSGSQKTHYASWRNELPATDTAGVLRLELSETVNKDRFIKGKLTNHYAQTLAQLLREGASSQEIYNYLSICKTISEPGAAEATVRNNLPQGVRIPYLIIEDLFESVGVKYLGWDDAETLLQAHKHGVPLRIDSKTGKRIPLVLTATELEDYQAHHDFRVAIHGFYKDYTKLINAQRAFTGEEPISDSADDYSMRDASEQPMSYREKLEMISKAKLRLQERDRKGEQERKERRIRQAAEEARKFRELENKKQALALKDLQAQQSKLEVEQKKLLEEQAKIQKAREVLVQQAHQNKEKMRLLAEKVQRSQKAQEERCRQEQEAAKRLAEDEALALALDKQLNGDEEFARNLDRQLNG